MPRSCCARVLDALCPCCRRRTLASSASRGAFGGHDMMSLNFILHGECNVGKTSLRNRWVDGIFTGDVAPTFGVDFNIKTLDLVQEVEEEEGNEDEEAGGPNDSDETQPGPGRKGGRSTKSAPRADPQVKINVYDTSGKPGYTEVNSTYLLAFDAVLFVYDISSMSSLNELRRYFNDPEHHDKLAAKKKAGMAMLLVGNKGDVPLSERQVGSQTGQDTAAEFGIPFVEVSAKTGANVREAFMFVTTRAVAEHLARERLVRPTGRGGRKSVERTMQRVPGLQTALRARASALDVFKGMTGRRKYAPKEQTGGTLAQRAKDGEGADNETGKNLQLPRRTAERAGSGQPRGGTETDFPKRPLGAGPDSPGATATAANSPVAQSGTGVYPTSSLLERPEVSPTAGSMFEQTATISSGGGSRPPRIDTSGGPLDTKVSPATAAGTARTRPRSPRCQQRGSPGGSPTHAHTRPPKSPAGSSSSRPPAAVSPRQARLDPELVGGDSPAAVAATANGRVQITHAGRGRAAATEPEQDFLLQRKPMRASPERTAGSVEESATRQLKEASSFWLDKWGVKAAKTDATRERHGILGASRPASPRGGSSSGKI